MRWRARHFALGFAPVHEWHVARAEYYNALYDVRSGRRAQRVALRNLRRRLMIEFLRPLKRLGIL